MFFWKTKSYQGIKKVADSCERRWNEAMKNGNAAEAYTACEDYKKCMQAQEENLKTLDPNSRDYAKAEMAVEEERATVVEMGYEHKRQLSSEQIKYGYQVLDAKNEQLSKEMASAIERGDVKNYESLKTQYEKNLTSQEQLGNQLKQDGVSFQDTVHQQKVDLLNKDIDMRNKLNEKVAEKGNFASKADREAADKYTNQVKKDEIELVKYQNDKKIEGMRERGASEEAIKYQKEENESAQKWVESINR